jgi:23S rRNA (cytosine1962-C5)-methyltransferase
MVDVSAFANRLQKNYKHYAKWAARQGLDAWRVYDKDVPQFPLAVDLYGDRVHLQEYDTGWEMEDEVYQQWIAAIIAAIAEVTGRDESAITLKSRRRQKGVSQYEKVGKLGDDFIVQSLASASSSIWMPIWTGLFLDHRNTRKRVREEAAGKRFLNLFAYTGSFTVYAGAGGAVSSETVDMSNTYQDWSRRNFELNGLDLARHQLVRADVFQYLEQAVDEGKQFDLIVMDPPTFSNSKKCRTSWTSSATMSGSSTTPWRCWHRAVPCTSPIICAASCWTTSGRGLSHPRHQRAVRAGRLPQPQDPPVLSTEKESQLTCRKSSCNTAVGCSWMSRPPCWPSTGAMAGQRPVSGCGYQKPCHPLDDWLTGTKPGTDPFHHSCNSDGRDLVPASNCLPACWYPQQQQIQAPGTQFVWKSVRWKRRL